MAGEIELSCKSILSVTSERGVKIKTKVQNNRKKKGTGERNRGKECNKEIKIKVQTNRKKKVQKLMGSCQLPKCYAVVKQVKPY